MMTKGQCLLYVYGKCAYLTMQCWLIHSLSKLVTLRHFIFLSNCQNNTNLGYHLENSLFIKTKKIK